MSDLTESDAEKAAHAEIARLCQPGERWRMTIPVNGKRDSDMILSRALDGAAARREADAETIRGLREELERLRADVEAFAESLVEQGDEHVLGCMGQADCAACVRHDLRAILARHERPEGEAVEEFAAEGTPMRDLLDHFGIDSERKFVITRKPEAGEQR